ncbi:MAG: 3-hydroxyacyl-CoA dehydrogenase family protein [Thermodesulfobacteriota bacterium]
MGADAEKVLVVGAGFMGAGIAQVCAAAGRRVFLMDNSPAALERAQAGIASSLARLAAKGKLADAAEAVQARISPCADLKPAAEADWVIEAAFESLPLKLDLFAELDRLAPAATPLASNTSSIPISRLAEAARRPERVLGLHFFGPVTLMGLVEVVKGRQTSEAVFERGAAFIQAIGKTPVKVARDIPGFVMNRVFAAAMREAVELVAAGVVSPEDLDVGMRLGYGWSAGPFEIADNAGLDTCVLINRFLKSVGEDGLAPRTDLLERMVQEGRVGRKAGRGFYRYDADGKRRPWGEDA